MQAIWKDIIVDLTTDLSGGKVDFVIYDLDNTVTLYSGTAYANEGGSCEVKLNDILADYLEQKLPAFGTADAVDTWDKLGLYYSCESQNIVADETVVFDYSYETLANTPTFPITGVIDRRLPLIFTARQSALKLNVTAGGTTTVKTFANVGAKNCYFYAPSRTGLTKVALYDSPYTAYEFRDTCCRYALYYVNAAGGWDTLLLEGNTRLIESYERTTFGRDYNNGVARNAGAIVLRNDITRTYQLQTGWLRESQAARMHHLLGSCLIYLCDMADGNALTPLILKTGTLDVRTHGSGAAAAKQYTIEAEVAREIVRR